MGLFSFAVKIGILAYAIDWMHNKSHEFRGYRRDQRSIQDSISETADETINQTCSPRFRQWLHESWSSCPMRERSRFASHPTISSATLPNGRTSLEIDVPGIKKDDMVVSVNEHEKVVIVKGTAVGNEQDGRRERHIEARIPLSRVADAADVKATMVDGVLRVDVGKKEFEGRRVVIE